MLRLQQKSVEWYTPEKYINAARQLMGGIDLDPASSATANQVVQATHFYDKATNGLEQPWPGRVWLNPPYCRTGSRSNQEIWTCRLIQQYEDGITTEAVLLVNASTDTRWFQRLWNYSICFVNHRIHYWSLQAGQGGPTHGSVFVYFGPNIHDFVQIFSRFGVVAQKMSTALPTLF